MIIDVFVRQRVNKIKIKVCEDDNKRNVGSQYMAMKTRFELSFLAKRPASTANNNRCDKWKRVSFFRVFSSSPFKCLSEAVVSSFDAHKRRWSFHFSFMVTCWPQVRRNFIGQWTHREMYAAVRFRHTIKIVYIHAYGALCSQHLSVLDIELQQ